MQTEKQRFLSNTAFLAVMQIANVLLPLLTVPFLIRVLGVEIFGQLAFVTALMLYFIVLSDYGFNLTATRDISIYRNDFYRVNEIYSSVIFIKVMLLLICLFILVLCVFLIPSLYQYWQLYLISFLTVVGQSLFPVWFFQGMEAMKYVMYFNVIAKVFFTAGVFLLVSSSDDYLWVPSMTAIGLFFIVVFSLYLIHFHYKIKFKFPSADLIKSYLFDGWYVFLSQIKVTLFSSTNIVVLGIVSGPVAVGYYVAAEKIMRALALAQTPITSALFPLIANKMIHDKVGAIIQLKKIAILGSVSYIMVLGLVCFFSDYLIVLLYTIEMKESVLLLWIMLPVPLLVFLNNIFGTQVLLNTGREKSFFYVLLIAAFLSLLLCAVLTYFYTYQGTAISVLVVEVFVVFSFFFLVRKDFIGF